MTSEEVLHELYSICKENGDWANQNTERWFPSGAFEYDSETDLWHPYRDKAKLKYDEYRRQQQQQQFG